MSLSTNCKNVKNSVNRTRIPLTSVAAVMLIVFLALILTQDEIKLLGIFTTPFFTKFILYTLVERH